MDLRGKWDLGDTGDLGEHPQDVPRASVTPCPSLPRAPPVSQLRPVPARAPAFPGSGNMSEGVDLIDIYADEEFTQDPEFSNADQMDLYDDVLAASSQPQEKRSSSSEAPLETRQEPSPKPNSKPPAILYTYSGLRNKRAAVYVGSFSWWTTDQQLIQTIRSVGVYDVVELKFAENRANGQSKGYAEVVVASENSVHKLLELLPGKILNGDKVEVRLATRQNLSQFEAQARKRVPPRAHSRDSVDAVDGRATPTENALPPARLEKPPSVLPFFSRPPALPLMGLPPPPMPPPPPLSSAFGVPPPPPGIPYQHLLPPPRLPPPLAVPPPGAVPPALHLNPAFFPPPTAALGPPPDTYGKAMAPYNHSSRELGPPIPAVSEGEFEEIMNRNRAISSSAISKAVSGASAGDYSNAIETLLTAIAVIKQSRVANDERCRVLLSSLKDCLHGIEAKSYSSSSSSSSRKRHRSRERSPSRSRESSRRHRDLLHSDDRHEEYFQERSREHERHRDRDRDRDRHH
ncbi:cleavage and polyadenylation specificity factor subunit 7 isoform X1 [Malurus melanocephalus]|uniref:cleavage and polyadenylation specificity factor subunit 7 isoform X1 n=2 Tax=Malurus melanocephalus TaxID=175006 RepID=UPI0025477DBA|nr:cleavage and polyadenylation specificity factor subunit 7 isoform X1 [Malurus melanocephalus]XP_057233363.1 cleavage and polyadenylation specificity factor subunit 7 isoform X1 [Malurus melanocephalus]